MSKLSLQLCNTKSRGGEHNFILFFNDFFQYFSVVYLSLNFFVKSLVRIFCLNNKKTKIKAVTTKLKIGKKKKLYFDDLGSLTGDRSENISRLAPKERCNVIRSGISKDR